MGYERTILGDQALLIIGARRPPSGPAFYFLFDASEVEDAILRLGQALLVGGLILVLLAALAGRLVARGLLRPVRDAASAAERIADGDLSARLDTELGDEFGQWAASFNRMAATLQAHVADLQEARAREQRFVADVSHELRTPLTALVAEASLLRDHLATLPDGGRRVGELLVADIGRLRGLVDDLMEVSRFDAGSERTDTTEFELAAFVRATASGRLPDAHVSVSDGPTRIVTIRAGLTASSPTCSTTHGSMPAARMWRSRPGWCRTRTDATAWSCRCRTAGPASRRPSSRSCSTASARRIRLATSAAAASGSPSPGSTPALLGGTLAALATDQAAACGSSCGYL